MEDDHTAREVADLELQFQTLNPLGEADHGVHDEHEDDLIEELHGELARTLERPGVVRDDDGDDGLSHDDEDLNDQSVVRHDDCDGQHESSD